MNVINVITVFALLLLLLTGQAESTEVSIMAVRSDGVIKSSDSVRAEVTLYGIEGKVLHKLAESFYVYGEGSFTAPSDGAEYTHRNLKLTLKPYTTRAELAITLEGDDTVMFTVGPVFRYTYLDLKGKAPGTSIRVKLKENVENWFVAESIRFRGQSGSHRLELIGKVYIPIAWKSKSKFRAYEDNAVIEEEVKKSHGPGEIGGKIEVSYGYKMLTVNTSYEYIALTDKTGINLFTIGVGITF